MEHREFSLLRDHLASIRDNAGNPTFEVATRNRETNSDGNDIVLSVLDQTDFDELWLFAVDMGEGLSVPDCQGITRAKGCPFFLVEQPGGQIKREPEKLGDIKAYVTNVARWLAPK